LDGQCDEHLALETEQKLNRAVIVVDEQLFD